MVIARRGTLAWLWTAVVLALSAIVAAASPRGIGVDDLAQLTAPTMFTALGAVLVTKTPGNRIAWLFFVIGAGLLIEPFAQARISDPPTDPTILDVFAIAAVDSTFFVFFLVPISLVLFIFPTGRFLGRRWSWAGRVAALISAELVFLTVFADEVGPDNADWMIPNPIGFHPFTSPDGGGAPYVVFGVGLLALLVSGPAAIVVRYRRSDPVTRTQIKWFAYAATMWATVWLYRLISDDRGLASSLATDVATILIPVSIVVAIIRYRLFDIDRLISRTLGYTVVVAVLALLFAGLTALPGVLIGGAGDNGSTSAPPVVVAASTLAVAAAFNPIRRRVIGLVERRFHRARYDAERVIVGFGDRLQDEVDLDRLTRDSVDVVVDTMHPHTIGIWIKE